MPGHHRELTPHDHDENAGGSHRTFATHGGTQAVPLNGVAIAPGTPPFTILDIPSPHPAILELNPLPTSPMDTVAIGASQQGIVVSVTPSTTDPGPRLSRRSAIPI